MQKPMSPELTVAQRLAAAKRKLHERYEEAEAGWLTTQSLVFLIEQILQRRRQRIAASLLKDRLDQAYA